MNTDVTIKMLEGYISTFKHWEGEFFPVTRQLIQTLISSLEIIKKKQQKEIKELKRKLGYENQVLRIDLFPEEN